MATMAMVRAQADRARNQLTRIREEKKTQLATAGRLISAGATSAALGYFEYRYPTKSTVLSVPISGVVGLAGAALMIFGDTDDSWVEGVATGGVCSYAYRMGAEVGHEKAQEESSA